jgi:ATP-dependent DNA ligase
VDRLRQETPAAYIAFDLLALADADFTVRPFAERRQVLESLLSSAPSPVFLTPITDEPLVAKEWLQRFSGGGIDGVVAKHASQRYAPGKRVMVKVKRERTLECVVAGFRVLPQQPLVASLLLGLYDAGRNLRHVGVTSSFTAQRRRELFETLRPHIVPLNGHPWESGFAIEGRPIGRLRGAAGVWTPELVQDWVPVAPRLVCEVAYDQVDLDRFRHPARFLRWRPDREPASCTFEQLEVVTPDVAELLAGAASR